MGTLLANDNEKLRARLRLRPSLSPLTISMPLTIERCYQANSHFFLKVDKSIRNEIIWSFKDKGLLEILLDELKTHVNSIKGRN